MLTWVDLETTGLDPLLGRILELGVIITDDRLSEIDRRSWVLPLPPAGRPLQWWMNDYVLDMHTRSGLLDECGTAGRPMSDVQEEARTWISDTHAGSLALMAGSSIHFDRSWIKTHMPDLDEVFGYRMVDVSSIKELVRRWAPNREYEVTGEKPHRALADIEHSIAELRHYATVLMSIGLG